MKVLLIPLYYHLHKEDPALFDGMEEAFNGVIYDGDIQNAIDYKPDFIVFQGSAPLEDCIKIKEATGAWFTMYTGDCRFAPMQSLMDYRSVVDCYYLPFTGELLDTYSKLLGKRCRFIWEAIQNWRFKELKPLNEGKITFVGNAYETTQSDRIELVRFLNSHVPEFECYGSLPFSKGEIPTTQTPEIYQNSYCVIAENNYNVEGYFTQRNIGAMAAGSCTLMKWFPDIESHFNNWVDCVYYRDKVELLDIVNFLRLNPEVRNRIAAAGHKLASTKYTYKNWAKDYI